MTGGKREGMDRKLDLSEQLFTTRDIFVESQERYSKGKIKNKESGLHEMLASFVCPTFTICLSVYLSAQPEEKGQTFWTSTKRWLASAPWSARALARDLTADGD